MDNEASRGRSRFILTCPVPRKLISRSLSARNSQNQSYLDEKNLTAQKNVDSVTTLLESRKNALPSPPTGTLEVDDNEDRLDRLRFDLEVKEMEREGCLEGGGIARERLRMLEEVG